jgi:hypothetical protein
MSNRDSSHIHLKADACYEICNSLRTFLKPDSQQKVHKQHVFRTMPIEHVLKTLKIVYCAELNELDAFLPIETQRFTRCKELHN